MFNSYVDDNIVVFVNPCFGMFLLSFLCDQTHSVGWSVLVCECFSAHTLWFIHAMLYKAV